MVQGRYDDMKQLTHEQYEVIEHAVARSTRVRIGRKGRREYVIVPTRLRVLDGREVIEARNPTTGHDLTIYLDEIDSIEALT
jgi:hypothetical protein